MPAVIDYAKTALFSGRSFETVYNELKNPPYNAETQAMVDYLKTKGYLEGYPDPKDLTQEQFEQILYNFYLDQIRNKTGNSEYSALDDWTIPEANEQGNANRDVYSGFTLLDGNTLPDIVVKGADKKYQSTSQEGINAVKSELMMDINLRQMVHGYVRTHGAQRLIGMITVRELLLIRIIGA